MNVLEHLPIAFTVLGTLALLVGGFYLAKYSVMALRILGYFRSEKLQLGHEVEMASPSMAELIPEPAISRRLAVVTLVPIAFVGYALWTYIQENVGLKAETAALERSITTLGEEKARVATLSNERELQIVVLNEKIDRLKRGATWSTAGEEILEPRYNELKIKLVRLESALAKELELAAESGRELQLEQEEATRLARQVEDLRKTVAEQKEEFKASQKYMVGSLLTKGGKITFEPVYGGVNAFSYDFGDVDQAAHYYQTLKGTADNYVKQYGYKAGKAALYQKWSVVWSLKGQSTEADAAYQTALALASEIRIPEETLVTFYGNLGLVPRIQRQLGTAVKFHQEALKVAKEQGYLWGEASANMDLGAMFYLDGDMSEAESYYKTALQLFNQGKNKTGMAMTHKNLAVLFEGRDPEKASRHRKDAMLLIENLAQQ